MNANRASWLARSAGRGNSSSPSPRRVGVGCAQAPRPVECFQKQQAVLRFAEVGRIDDRLCVRVCRGNGQMTSASRVRDAEHQGVSVTGCGHANAARKGLRDHRNRDARHHEIRCVSGRLRVGVDVGERLRMLRLGRRKELTGAIHIAGGKQMVLQILSDAGHVASNCNPRAASVAPGPRPDRISIAGVPTTPAARTTARRAPNRWAVPPSRA